MSAHIRLTRTGKKKRPSYRVVVVDSREKRDGAYIENLGYYLPVESQNQVSIDLDRYNEWVKNGAMVSNVVSNLVKRQRKGS